MRCFRFFTIWSFIAFCITLILMPFDILPTWIVRAVLINEITVGIAGNILAVLRVSSFLKDTHHTVLENELYGSVVSNLIFHVAPMALACYLLPMQKSGNENSIILSFALLVVFFIAYCAVPCEDMIFANKLKCVYIVEANLYSLLAIPIAWFILLITPGST